MNKKISSLVSLMFFIGLGFIPGCTHYTLRPDLPESMPRVNSDASLPYTVGIVIDEDTSGLQVGASGQDLYAKKQLIDNKGLSLAPRFAQALRQSKLFQDVRFPMRLSKEAFDDIDMVISGKFGYKFVQDPAQGPKIILVCFTGFITGALLRETSHHITQGVLTLTDVAGKTIKTYDETVDVNATSMVSMFAEMKTMEKGPPAAVENLVAKLVQSLIDDKSLLARAIEARRKSPPKAAAAPAVQPTETEQPPAAAPPAPSASTDQPVAPTQEPAAPAPPPEPEKPKPIVPTTKYDDQLFP